MSIPSLRLICDVDVKFFCRSWCPLAWGMTTVTVSSVGSSQYSSSSMIRFSSVGWFQIGIRSMRPGKKKNTKWTNRSWNNGLHPFESPSEVIVYWHQLLPAISSRTNTRRRSCSPTSFLIFVNYVSNNALVFLPSSTHLLRKSVSAWKHEQNAPVKESIPVIVPPTTAMPKLTPSAAAWKPACSRTLRSDFAKILDRLQANN